MWSESLSVVHKHAFDKSGTLRNFFNVGPFVTDGGIEVINNQLFKLSGQGVFEVTAGPSTRRVIDFSDIENAKSILPTGQSGNVFSKHYKDQAQKYLNGEFVKMMLNKDEIRASKDVLILLPPERNPDRCYTYECSYSLLFKQIGRQVPIPPITNNSNNDS